VEDHIIINTAAADDDGRNASSQQQTCMVARYSDGSHTSVVLWIETIRIISDEDGCGPPSAANASNDGYHFDLSYDQL